MEKIIINTVNHRGKVSLSSSILFKVYMNLAMDTSVIGAIC